MSRERVDLSALMCDIVQETDDAPPAPEPEPEWSMPEPDPVADEKYGQDRRGRILMIQIYLNTFPEKLSQYKKTDLESLSNDELAKLLEEMQYMLDNKGNVSAAVRGMIMGLGALENITVMFTPAKIGGLTQTISSDQDAVDDMKAIALKHVSMVHVEPEIRLAMRVISSALMLHTINSQKEAAAPVVDKKTPATIDMDPPGISDTPEKFAAL